MTDHPGQPEGRDRPLVSVTGWLIDAADRHSHRAALMLPKQTLSYDALFAQAAALAADIKSNLAGSSPACAMLTGKTATGYAAVLAAFLSGGIYVPLNQRYPPQRNHFMLSFSGARVLIADAAAWPAAEALLAKTSERLVVLLPDHEEVPQGGGGAKHHDILCRPQLTPVGSVIAPPTAFGGYLLFTSGSTGTPKAVFVEEKNLLSYLSTQHEHYRPGPSDRFSQLFDFTFDLSLHDMMVCWTSGACLCPPTDAAALGFSSHIIERQLTFWFSVPSTVSFMARYRMLRPKSFPSLRWSLFCGEALPTALASLWQASAPNSVVENLYGPTEATIAITGYRVPRSLVVDGGTVPIGRPFPGQSIRVAGEDGLPVADGGAGELWLSGSQVVAGYWKDDSRTAESFVDDAVSHGIRRWYKTGDRVRADPDGTLQFLGRLDRQVKIRGFRVELGDIEAALRPYSKSARCAIVAIVDANHDHGLVSLFGFIADPASQHVEILAGLRTVLPDYMVPERLVEIKQWPLSANGKTDYGTLRGIASQWNIRDAAHGGDAIVSNHR